VRHPVGNIADFLLKEGLARCVDHHSTWLGSEMGKLRQAEKHAKDNQFGLFKSHVATRTEVASSMLSSAGYFRPTPSSSDTRMALSVA